MQQPEPFPRLALALVLAATCALSVAPSAAQEAPAEPERIHRYGTTVNVLGGSIHVPPNVVEHGLVFSLGGDVRIEGEVHEVVVIGGTLEVTGRVRDQVVGVLTRMKLENAEVGEQVVNVLGSYEAPGSEVRGQVVNIGLGSWFPGLGWLFFWARMVGLVTAFVVLLLLAALVPQRIRLIADEAPTQYLNALLAGVLGYLGMLIVVSLLAATVVGIPLALLVFYVLRWLGIAGIFLAVGQRLGRLAGVELSLLGAVLLCFALYAVPKLALSFLGVWGLVLSIFVWMLFLLLVDLPGIGLLILTRAGTRPRGAPVAAAPAPAVATAPPIATTLDVAGPPTDRTPPM